MPSRRILSLALLSGGSLLLELALTRIVSAVYYPPYVFAILSLAILGIGIGAALAAAFPFLRDQNNQWLYLLGAAILSIFLVVATAHNDALGGFIFVLVPLPYVGIGLTYAAIFSRTPERSGLLYMADLIGAGAGAVLSIPIMNLIDPINAILLAGVLLTLAGLYPLVVRAAQTVVVFALIFLLATNLGLHWLTVNYTAANTSKPIQQALSTGQIIDTHWDAFGRTDLVKPADGTPYELYLDGAAASIMPPGDGSADSDLIDSIGFFPFATNQPSKVLIIGPGGGLDVWFGLRGKAQDITAVEVNPASIDVVRDYAQYNGNLYEQAAVHPVVDEGRSLLDRDPSKYDEIFLSQVVTLTDERLGYSLTENTIYTVEAFQDYLAHLTDKGQIGLVLYDEITLTRALSTALAALRSEGMTDAQAMEHIMAYVDLQTGKPTPLLMISKAPFTKNDSLTYNAVAHQVGFQPLFLPQVYAQAPLDAVESGSRTFSNIIDESDSDISPPTDDRPFFFQFERGLSPDLAPLVGFMAGVIVFGGFLLFFAQKRVRIPAVRWSPIYFAALGVGFIMIEVTIIQETHLFLGHPTYAVTTTIATLLVGGGIGSLIAERLRLPSARWPLIGVIAVLIVWLLLWPLISQAALAAPLEARIAIAVICLLPLSLLIGMPFSLGLRLIVPGGGGQIALAWAVNGVMSVAGTIGATALATLTGYRSVLIGSVIAYAIAAIYAFAITRVTPMSISTTATPELTAVPSETA